jgi:putrescine:ornithine antiporter
MQEQKKMNLMQLTFLVAVNMMGSGIIMLPTNMSKVGAISLLSWIVTALRICASRPLQSASWRYVSIR